MAIRRTKQESKGQESLQQDFKSGEETPDSPSRMAGDVTALSSDGRGIVKVKEQVYFAERVVPGDRVTFVPDLDAKPAVARESRVLRPSPDRCDHPCKHAADCPASEWGIIGYPLQLKEKTGLVKRVLRGVVGPETVKDIWPSPQQWGYRSRLTLQVEPHTRGGFELGYSSGARGAGFVPIKNCLLGNKTTGWAVRHLAAEFRDARSFPVDIFPGKVTVFETSEGAGAMAIYKGRPRETDVQQFLEFAEGLRLPGGFWAASGNSVGVVGERGTFWRVKESCAMQVGWLGHNLEVHPAGFAQVNDGATDKVLEYLKSNRSRMSAPMIWDLYGGYGALGFALAEKATQLEVVEQNGLSLETFEQLQAIRPEVNANFQQAEVNRLLPKIKGQLGREDLVILDPPRSGCHPEVLDLLGKSRVRRILYMSCNPARLARDLKLLMPFGFHPQEVQPVDFFPQTPEIEVLAVVER